jgi:hypothetical protein
MAITTRDQLVAAMAGPYGWSGYFFKNGTLASQSKPLSAWTHASILTPAGATPTGPEPCSGDTTGALPVPRVQTPGNTLYLSALQVWNNANGHTWMLLDRAAHTGGLVANITTSQSVNLAAHSRFTSTVGVQAFIEIYSSPGSGGAPVTLTYTNSDGVAGRTATLPTFLGWTPNMLVPFQLAAGDAGVASVQSLRFSTAAAGAGNIGITLAKTLHIVPAASGGQFSRRNYTTMLNLTTNPCLFWSYAGTAGSFIQGVMSTVEG